MSVQQMKILQLGVFSFFFFFQIISCQTTKMHDGLNAREILHAVENVQLWFIKDLRK